MKHNFKVGDVVELHPNKRQNGYNVRALGYGKGYVIQETRCSFASSETIYILTLTCNNEFGNTTWGIYGESLRKVYNEN